MCKVFSGVNPVFAPQMKYTYPLESQSDLVLNVKWEKHGK